MSSLFNSLVKASTNALKTSIAEFDFDAEMKAIKEKMANASQKLSNEIKKIQKHIHNYFDKWVIDVDFNQKTDTITSQIKDNVINIIVINEENSAKTEFSTTIPDNVVIDSLVQKYDPKNKKALFVFSKKV